MIRASGDKIFQRAVDRIRGGINEALEMDARGSLDLAHGLLSTAYGVLSFLEFMPLDWLTTKAKATVAQLREEFDNALAIVEKRPR